MEKLANNGEHKYIMTLNALFNFLSTSVATVIFRGETKRNWRLHEESSDLNKMPLNIFQ